MKKILTLFLAISVLTTSFAMVVEPPKKASEVFFPIGKEGARISLENLAYISVKDFQALTGQKMNLVERMGFKSAQKELKRSINADGSINNDALTKFIKKADGSSGFHLGGFALGFLLGLIGVLLAYVLFNDANKSNRIKWSWLGLAAFVVLWLVVGVSFIF